jgi:BNR repeat-like domain
MTVFKLLWRVGEGPGRHGMWVSLALLVAASGSWAMDAPKVVRITAEQGAKQPQAAIDEDGTIHVAYGVANDVRYTSSSDGGMSWGDPVTVGSPGVLSLGMRRGPRVAVSDGAVIVMAIGGANGKGLDGDLFAWRSMDDGRTWSAPVQINGFPGSAREGLHSLASGPNGRLFCAWVDLRDGSPAIRGAFSTDAGASWNDDAEIPRVAGDLVCPCCHPSCAFGPDGALYVMWRGNVDGNRDMMLAQSKDGGSTFEPTQKLGEGSWKFNACPMDGGSIVIGEGGSVSTFWMREGRMYQAGAGKPEDEVARGVQGWSAVRGKQSFRAWLETRPGALMIAVPGTGPRQLARGAFDPMVASGAKEDGPVVVVWESSEGNGLFAARLD